MRSYPNSKNGFYFTQDTQDAIIEYNSITDTTVRAHIFQERIYYPFYKLAENIIHTFKFYYLDVDDIEDLKHKVVVMLLEEKINKYNPNLGTKAYSYFGTIVKRWLINYNNINFKELSRRGTFDEFKGDQEDPEEYIEENSITLSEFFTIYVDQMYQELPKLFKREKDIRIADAVLTLFKTRQDLEIFRKKAVYIYIREIIDCKTTELTQVIKVLKTKFYNMYNYKHGMGLIQ